MNKNRYRVVLNRARGLVMVVSDIAVCAQPSSSRCTRSIAPSPAVAFRLNRLSLGVLLLTGGLSFSSYGTIIADKQAPAAQQPTVLQTANGLVQVNIQTPSAAGVSHNKYRQFDVESRGAILNNAHQATQTQLAGHVAANPWLAKGEARIILNEVNSRDPSLLNGMLEVAGRQAQVVIANPAGITCDGCGFINANRATLTTGQAQFVNGQLQRYDVERGRITVTGKGLDSSRQDHTELLARAITINASVQARALSLTTGRNQIDADNGKVVAQGGEGDERPAFALDVSELGGMYANKIVMLGTESGVGVHNAGNLGAMAGDVVITAEGNLTHRGKLYASGDLRLTSNADIESSGVMAAGIAAAGQVSASGNLLLSSQGSIRLSGQSQASGQLMATAAGVDAQAAQITATQVSLVAREGNINTQNAVLVADQVRLHSAKQLNNDGGAVEAKHLLVQAQQLSNRKGALRSQQEAELIFDQQIDNRQGLIASNQQLKITGRPDTTVLNDGGSLIAGQALDLRSGSLTGGGDLLSQGSMALVVANRFLQQGRIMVKGALSANFQQGIDNFGLLQAGGVMQLQTTQLTNAANATISAGATHLRVEGQLTNQGVIDGGVTHLEAAQVNNTAGGRIYGDQLAIAATTLTQRAEAGDSPVIAARQSLSLALDNLNNLPGSLILSAGTLTLGGQLDARLRAIGQSRTLINHGARIESLGAMTLAVNALTNSNEQLITQQVETERSRHHQAVLSGSTTRYDWQDVDTQSRNQYGVHQAKMPDGSQSEEFYEYQFTRTVMTTEVSDSKPGQIIAGGDLTITSQQVVNQDSRVIAGGVLSGVIGRLQNLATKGQQIITDIGEQTRWYAKKRTPIIGGTRTSQGKETSRYTPTPVIKTIDLQQMRWQEQEPVKGNAQPLAARDGLTAAQLKEQVTATSHRFPLTVPDVTQLNTRLYQLRPASEVPFLIETDPRFTQGKRWLSSDRLFDQLAWSTGQLPKRLGDGFYEQELVREQLLALTGDRLLTGFDNDEQQYRALLDAGVAYAKQFQLVPGMALSAEQMAQLTGDMVWLVEQSVTLPDGSRHQVWVPQLYLRPGGFDLNAQGTLLAGRETRLQVKEALFNSGALGGKDVTQIQAQTITNTGEMVGGELSLFAEQDVVQRGGRLQGTRALSVFAGRDLISETQLAGDEANRWVDRGAEMVVQQAGGALRLHAQQDLLLSGSQVRHEGKTGDIVIDTGRDLKLTSVTTIRSEAANWGKGNTRREWESLDQGSVIQGQGEITLTAGRDARMHAASVQAGDSLRLSAGGNIAVVNGQRQTDVEEHQQQRSIGLLSTQTTTRQDRVATSQAVASALEGEQVELKAAEALTLVGSRVVGSQQVELAAGGTVLLSGAQNSRQEMHTSQQTRRGLSGTGGIGVSIGVQQQRTRDDGESTSVLGSLIGSSDESVRIKAGTALRIEGSDLLAKQAITLTAQEVTIDAAQTSARQSHRADQKSQGVTLALSGVVGSLINQAVTQATSASQASSGRLAALEGIQSALSGVQAYQAGQLAAPSADSPGSMIGINLSLGSQSAHSVQTQTQQQSQGSQLTAGGALTVAASDGDIRVVGSGLQAGSTLHLDAQRDVLLSSAQNRQQVSGKNSQRGGAIGVGINFGEGSNGISINASVNTAQGRENGQSLSHRESILNAGELAQIASGRDTTLQGAQLSADRVDLQVGRDLTLRSEQDTEQYSARQTSASAGGSVSMGGGSLSVNLSRDTTESEYASVQEQTGIFAGQGGFTIDVGAQTQLTGAVIASQGLPQDNLLQTGSLGFASISNHAEYEVTHFSAGVSTSGAKASELKENLAPSGWGAASGSGQADSVTGSAISDGKLIIRDEGQQLQDLSTLSRDVAQAHQALTPIFDKEKEQRRLREAQLISRIGSQVAEIVRSQGEMQSLKAAREQHPTLSDKALRSTEAYKKASEQYGTGSTLQRAISASTAAIQGLAGGDMSQALTGAAAPYLATVIKKTVGEENKAANLMAHAVVNATLSLVREENAWVGASSAVIGEAVGMISQAYYGKKASELSESQKQTVSALASLAAGLAGGLVGGDKASAVSGMQTGKVTVENNSLGDNKPGHDDDELKREHGDRELKVISMKPWTGSLLDDNGNPIPGAYKAGSVMPVAGKGTTGSLSGQPTKLPPNASPENIRSLQRENEGATILSKNGYHVEQNPVTAGVKNPDYKINGEVFDNIAPKTNSVRNIYDRALEKVNSGQTNNVVINLADTKASISDLQKQFNDWPIKGLDKVIAIDQSGNPIRIK